MAHRMGADSLLTLEEVLELIFGSLLQKRLISLRKTVCLNWGMVGKLDYGKTLGVEDNLSVLCICMTYDRVMIFRFFLITLLIWVYFSFCL